MLPGEDRFAMDLEHFSNALGWYQNFFEHFTNFYVFLRMLYTHSDHSLVADWYKTSWISFQDLAPSLWCHGCFRKYDES